MTCPLYHKGQIRSLCSVSTEEKDLLPDDLAEIQSN